MLGDVEVVSQILRVASVNNLASINSMVLITD